MADLILIMILAAVIAAAVRYICREKKRGVKCIGCAAGKNGCCGSCDGSSTCCGCADRKT